jgi:hypothetical protein
MIWDKAASGRCRTFPFSTECVCRSNSCVEAEQDSVTFSCTIYYILRCVVCYITFLGIRDTIDQEITTTLAYSNTAYSHRHLRSLGYGFCIGRGFAFARRRLLGARLLLLVGRVQGKVDDFAFDDILGRARQRVVGALYTRVRALQKLMEDTLTRPRMVIFTRR